MEGILGYTEEAVVSSDFIFICDTGIHVDKDAGIALTQHIPLLSIYGMIMKWVIQQVLI